jgi:hypothetical protein
MFQHGVLSRLAGLIHTPQKGLQARVICSLGAIAAASPAHRIRTLNEGILAVIEKSIGRDPPPAVARATCWTLNMLCDSSEPRPEWQQVRA